MSAHATRKVIDAKNKEETGPDVGRFVLASD
jgi:hypothetical protein